MLNFKKMKMKKLRYILALLIVSPFALLTSCDKDFEEVNTNPNDPLSVPAELLLAGTIRSTGDRIQDIFLAGEAGSCWYGILGNQYTMTTNCIFLDKDQLQTYGVYFTLQLPKMQMLCKN